MLLDTFMDSITRLEMYEDTALIVFIGYSTGNKFIHIFDKPLQKTNYDYCSIVMREDMTDEANRMLLSAFNTFVKPELEAQAIRNVLNKLSTMEDKNQIRLRFDKTLQKILARKFSFEDLRKNKNSESLQILYEQDDKMSIILRDIDYKEQDRKLINMWCPNTQEDINDTIRKIVVYSVDYFVKNEEFIINLDEDAQKKILGKYFKTDFSVVVD